MTDEQTMRIAEIDRRYSDNRHTDDLGAYYRDDVGDLRALVRELDSERRRLEQVVKDFAVQIIEARRLREAEERIAGRAMAWAAPLPKGYEYDHMIFPDKESAADEIGRKNDEWEEGEVPEPIPLYALPPTTAIKLEGTQP